MLAITGATGKSGKTFSEYVLSNIVKINEMFPKGIRLITHKRTDTVLGDKAESVCGDLEDVDFLKKAFEGVDTIVHIAGIHWSREVTEAAAFCGVRRLICVHTTGIYSKYKEAGEEYRHIDDFVYKTCGEAGIKLSILRPTMIYGSVADKNVITFIKMVDKLPIMPVVSGARYDLQPVHYKDLGKAYFDVLMSEDVTAGKDYILSGREPIRLRDMFKVMAENLNRKVHFISVPFPIAFAGAVFIYGLSFGKIDMREKVQRLCESRAYPHEEAARDFGYAPCDFAEGVKDEIKEYLELKVQ